MNTNIIRRVMIFIIFFTVMTATYTVTRQILPMIFKSDSDFNLSNIASEANKNLPMMIDKETRLDNVTALSNTSIQYRYTVVNYDKDSLDISALKESITPTIKNIVKTSPDVKILREKEIVFKYSYWDKIGQFLFDITVTPKEYK